MRVATTDRVRGGLLGLLACTALLLALAAPSEAAIGPKWRLDSPSNTTAQPGGILDYRIQATNVGDADMDGGPIVLEVSLPPGLSVLDPAIGNDPTNPHFEPNGFNYLFFGRDPFGFTPCTAPDGSPLAGGESGVRCELPLPLRYSGGGTGYPEMILFLPTAVDVAAAPGTAVTEIEIEGGGAPAAAIADPVEISPSPPGFGVDAFDVNVRGGDDGAFTQAAGHPAEVVTDLDFNNVFEPIPQRGPLYPVGGTRNAIVDLPPGFLGNPAAFAECTLAELANNPAGGTLTSQPLCPAASQVGVAAIRIGDVPPFQRSPLYNMAPPPGAPARFGFIVLGTLVFLDARLRSEGDYGLSVASRNIPEALAVAGSNVTFWGVPADPVHRTERACPDSALTPITGGPTCEAGTREVPFLRMPSRCAATMPWKLAMDSWKEPGGFAPSGAPDLSDPAWVEDSIVSHAAPGYPYPRSQWGVQAGVDGCADVPVKGKLSAQPTSIDTETASGLAVHLEVPNPGLENPDAISSSDLKRVEVALPRGVTINPSQAEGLGTCSPDRYESTVLSFHPTPGRGCPDDSKIGTVEVRTPLLEETIPGDVYIARQYENPFGSLLALYVVLAEPERGILVKLAGKVELEDPEHPGQIVTTFDDLPQLPFDSFDFKFREGARAPLVTPPTCGKYTTEAEITGHSDPGNPITSKSSFEIVRGIGGGPCPSGGIPPFGPGFTAGAVNPSAGAFSPFVMRLTRNDGEQDLTKFNSILPPGVSAKIAGVEKCSDAAVAAAQAPGRGGREELAAPSCPAGAEIGRTLAGAGVGSVLTYVPGKLYLAGPYNGAPLSVVAITPAVAGPFDVGVVVVRQGLGLDPVTAEVRVDGERSDPIPHILEGIPLKLRDLRVYVDREDFTINPTSCDPMQVGATLFGSYADVFNPADDVPVARSSRFQAANCAGLGFKPRLGLRLKGGVRRGAHPALRAVLRPRPGDANLARTVVKLPRSAFLDQAHIRTICTRVQFAADACPKGAIYGRVTAFTPLLDEPLRGPAYLRSSNNKLPDLVFDLRGVVDIETSARIDSVRGGIRATFPFVPDAPLTKVVVEMQGGRKGLIVNSRNLCAAPSRAAVKLDGHNGKPRDLRPVVRPRCGKAAGGRHARR